MAMGAGILHQWLKTPALVGAILPSSKHLAKVMARHAGDSDAAHAEFESHDTPTEQAALVELAERVSAARSVV